MALSNIFEEPRREITETLIGMAAMGGFLYLDYKFAVWFQGFSGGSISGCPWPLGMVLGIPYLMAIALVAIVIHRFGDYLCAVLENHGVQVRPKQRYR